MVDFVSREKRGNIMRGSRSKDTRPELAIRQALHGLGYRYRLHSKDLPGKPDIVFPKRKKAVFVHGCFWHQHDDDGCKITRKPSSNSAFWDGKFSRNQARDAANLEALQDAGWSVMTLWECEVSRVELLERLQAFLGPTRLR